LENGRFGPYFGKGAGGLGIGKKTQDLQLKPDRFVGLSGRGLRVRFELAERKKLYTRWETENVKHLTVKKKTTGGKL